jgi:3-deoxy-D-manno-octulosonate 8-phosphate phosphatase (KDO 8-P phosphatase)
MDLQSIKMIVFDVDGVLTDGSIILDDAGVETKRFHVRDGAGIASALAIGFKVGVITGRSSRVVSLRMAELRIPYLLQHCKDKGQGLETLCQEAGILPEQCAYMGDDLIDLPALLRCGYRLAVADAAAEVRSVAHYVTTAPGGRGAAREAIEHILKAQGKWDQVLERYGI